MLPIAVLPAAALLLRFGQDDMLGVDGLGGRAEWLLPVAKVMAASGDALFTNLPLLFAVGIAFGFAKKGDGSAALAGLVGYLSFHAVSMIMFAESSISDNVLITAVDGDGELYDHLDMGMQNPTGVLGGIVVGLLSAYLWKKYHRIKLPTWLSFFGGRRFVPIATAVTGLLLGVLAGLLWPMASIGVDAFGDWMATHGGIGALLYGMANRLLVPFGLHHIINSVVWFTIPGCNVDGQTASGDLNCYFLGQEGAGTFMAGYFPIMMFAIPAIALAFWATARPENKKTTLSFAIATGTTAFVTGITEPVEFAFIFIAPLLFGIHVVMTGVSMFIADLLNIKIGFGFSAGLIDYLLNFGKSNTSNPLLVLVVGLIYFVVYFLIFYYLIKKLNLPTPGREPAEGTEENGQLAESPTPATSTASTEASATDTPPQADGDTGDKPRE
ncbi:PTS transporter subunit EIIC [Natronoglycomyces albus]|uniref:PTS transporter subunit EIIC n=2 Tax=Natronoglycomyces albus TaxID=2811108 RepID=A0A895XTX5_9ACTN|nr:PTS transporter subunit EIIC [Natronoglycomyces albus]